MLRAKGLQIAIQWNIKYSILLLMYKMVFKF